MSNKDSKKTIFNKIAALRTDTNSYIKNKIETTNEFVKTNETIQFLIDVLKTLENISEMAKTIIDMIHKESEKVENDLKGILIKSINDIILCYTDAKTPSSFITEGVFFKVSDFDFNQILHIDPMSDEGGLIYFDAKYGLDSRDFNVFLYNVFQTPEVSHSWGRQGGFDPIITVMFKKQYNGMNDVVIVKISALYSGVKFSKFFHDLLESMDLIDTKTLLNNLVDSVYGTVSVNTNSAFNTLKEKSEVDTIVNRMSETGESLEKAMEFTGKYTKKMEETLSTKVGGLYSINDAVDNEKGSLSMETLKNINNSIETVQNISETDKILSNALYSLGTVDLLSVNSVNVPTINYKFIETIVKNLGSMLVSVTLSPKIVLIMLIALKKSSTDETLNLKEFLKKNSGIFDKIISGAANMVISFLVKKCEKAIKKLVEDKIKKVMKERAENKKKQLTSLK